MPVCIQCNSPTFRILCDLSSSKTIQGKILECKNCGLIFKNPIPTEDTLEKLYNSENYSNENYFQSIFGHRMPQERLWERVLNLQSELKGRKVLDIGCGNGEFLDFAGSRGMGTYGIEISQRLADRIKPIHRISRESFEKCNFPENHFDLITLFDIIEHLTNPFEYLKRLKILLKTGGNLAIFTPDIGSLPVNILQILRKATLGRQNLLKSFIFDGYHIFFFNKINLVKYLVSQNFKKVHISDWPVLMRGNEVNGNMKILIKLIDFISSVFGKRYRMLLVFQKE